jgi:CheY-like chemotaxis protein
MRFFSSGVYPKTDTRPILVVDDDAAVRRALVRVLRKEGFEVIATDRGFKVLNLCLKYRPYLVFLDLVMPGMDGAQVVELLHARLFERAPRIVLVTGTWLPIDVKSALGVVAYLQKPFDLNHIVSLARKYLAPSDSDSLDYKAAGVA